MLGSFGGFSSGQCRRSTSAERWPDCRSGSREIARFTPNMLFNWLFLLWSCFNRPFHVVNAGYERYFAEPAEPVTRSCGFSMLRLSEEFVVSGRLRSAGDLRADLHL